MALMQNFNLKTITSPQEFNKSIPVEWTMDTGVDVTINVTQNGIPCCSAGPLTATTGQCNCLISNPFHSTVEILVTASNQVSGPLTKSMNVEVIHADVVS